MGSPTICINVTSGTPISKIHDDVSDLIERGTIQNGDGDYDLLVYLDTDRMNGSPETTINEIRSLPEVEEANLAFIGGLGATAAPFAFAYCSIKCALDHGGSNSLDDPVQNNREFLKCVGDCLAPLPLPDFLKGKDSDS